MLTSSVWWIRFLLVLAVGFSPTAALSEGFIEGRFGGAFTEKGHVEVSARDFELDTKLDFEDSISVGMKGGYWLDVFDYVGFAFDVSYFAPDIDEKGVDVDVDVVPFSALVMLRLPIFRSDARPHGLLQPYVAAGPGVFLTVVRANDFLGIDGADYKDVAVDVGVDVRSGLNVQITDWAGVFFEYRYTGYKAKFDDDIADVGVDADLDLDTHHVTAGFGFHF
jgi:opacity protein-like surface antigen